MEIASAVRYNRLDGDRRDHRRIPSDVGVVAPTDDTDVVRLKIPARFVTALCTAGLVAAPVVAATGSPGTIATIDQPAERGGWDRVTASCDLATVAALQRRHPDVEQFVVMATDTFASSTGTVWTAARRNGSWTCDTGGYAARFGRNGTRPLIQRRSGDGTTPAGVFPLGVQTAWDGQRFSMFGNRAEPDHLRTRYRRVRRQDCWGATPQQTTYQRLVNRPGCPGPDDEWLARFGDVYAHAAVIGANLNQGVSGDAPGEPAYAAAIFMHRHSYTARGTTKPTSGCVSLDLASLVFTMQNIDPALNPHFAIGPRSWLRRVA